MTNTRSESGTPRGKIPWAFLGLLCLVAVIETLLAGREIDFTSDPWGWDWRANSRSAAHRSRDCDVLCFGDSLVKFAVTTKVIEEKTGLRAYNLALGSGTAPASYFQFRRALEAGARPKAVLVDFWTFLLLQEPNVNPRMLSQVATPRDCLDLGWATGDGSLLGRVAGGGVLTSLRCRYEIRAGILAALNGRSSSNREEVLAFYRNWRANKGSMVWPRHPWFVETIRGKVENMPGDKSEGWRISVYPDSWVDIAKVNREYMNRFFELAEAHRIPVFYILTPLHPVVQARREQIGFDASHTRFVRSVQARFPSVTIVDGRHSGFVDKVFMDFIHLDRQGAHDFSTDLADILRRSLAGRADLSRWVDLPPYHGPTTVVAVEDLDQSRLAVKQQGDKIRIR